MKYRISIPERLSGCQSAKERCKAIFKQPISVFEQLATEHEQRATEYRQRAKQLRDTLNDLEYELEDTYSVLDARREQAESMAYSDEDGEIRSGADLNDRRY